MSAGYEVTDSGCLKFDSDQAANQVITLYMEENDLYLGKGFTGINDPNVDRVYQKRWTKYLLQLKATRVGEVISPENGDVREELETIADEVLE